MPQQRRKNDKCLAKRFWEQAEPYWQMGSTALSGLTVFVAVILWVDQVNGYEERISGLEGMIYRLERKIDFMMGRMGMTYMEEH